MASSSSPTPPTPPPLPSATKQPTATATASPPPSQTLLYFAYGSNLSTTQMALRCPDAKPIGLGRLGGWAFMINARGFANVVPSTATSTTSPASSILDASPAVNQDVSCATKIPKAEADGTVKGQASNSPATETESGLRAVVYGVVYQLASHQDKELLDGYEGVSVGAYEDLILPIQLCGHKRGAAEAGKSCKWKWGWKHWLGKHKERGDNDSDDDSEIMDKAAQSENKDKNEEVGVGAGMVWALVYVDRLRTSGAGEHQPREEYVGRMNRGIRESGGEWGLPREYVRGVLRRFIPEEHERSDDFKKK